MCACTYRVRNINARINNRKARREHDILLCASRLSVTNGVPGTAGPQEALINGDNSHQCISRAGVTEGPTPEKNQRNVKKGLFVNTINNFVFLRKPFIIWKPPLVKDAPGFSVRRGHQSHPSHGASSGLSKAQGTDTHIYSYLKAS